MKTWKVTAEWPVTLQSVGYYEAETAEEAQELAEADDFFYGAQNILDNSDGPAEWEVTCEQQ
jgi:hypothetical protein